MDARDELALELFIADNHAQPREQSIVDWEWFNATENYRGRIEHYKVMALGAIDAGYGKPRVVSTVEELDTLPDYTVIADNDDDIWQKRGGEWCSYETSPHTSARLSKYVPLVVLHEGAVTV